MFQDSSTQKSMVEKEDRQTDRQTSLMVKDKLE